MIRRARGVSLTRARKRWEPAGHGRKLACCGASFQRVRYAAMTDLLSTLTARGFVQDATPGLAERLSKGRVTAYVGFDPTADSLHVGSLVPVMGLAWLQRHGHTPIALVGGGTGMVGDPSGKREERPVMTLEQIDRNAQEPRAAAHAASSRSRAPTPPGCGTTPTGSAVSP